MTFDWLKTLLGDAYTEDIDKTVATEIGKRFTAKADFEAKSTELKNAKAQLAEANKTIEGLQAADKDIEAVRKEAAEYKAKAEQAEKTPLRSWMRTNSIPGLTAWWHRTTAVTAR